METLDGNAENWEIFFDSFECDFSLVQIMTYLKNLVEKDFQ